MVLTATMNMKDLRQRAGLSAEVVAVKLGKAHSTIRNWESGKSRPTLEPSEMVQLCKLYGCTLEQLEEAVKETGKLVSKR